MRVLLGLAVLVCLSVCGPSLAQEESDSTLARREALVREYFDAIGFDKLMEASASTMIDVQVESLPDSSELSAEAREIIAEVSREVMHDAIERIAERYVSVYAEAFSEQELQALVDFYDSRLGRSITSKSAVLAAQSGPIMAEIMPEIEADMRARMCNRIKCGEDRK